MRTLGYMVTWIALLIGTLLPGLLLARYGREEDWMWVVLVSYVAGVICWLVSTKMFERYDEGCEG